MSVSLPDRSGIERERKTQRTVDWLFTDIDWVVTCDASMRCIRSGAVAIDGDSLRAVGPTAEVCAQFAGRRTVDLAGYLVLPGLINTHTHAAMSCFRGLADDLPLEQWLFETIFPVEAATVDPDLVYWGTLLAAVEMLQNGITTFCDGYFFEEHAARAAAEAGCRAVLGQGILDFPTPDQPHPGRSRERAEAFLENFPRAGDRIRPSLFCHALYTCSEETLQWVKALCRERDLLFQIHLSETAAEVESFVRERGERPAFALERLGILEPQTLCVHGVWLDSSEIDLLARTGTKVSHDVESNMKLGSGCAPVSQMLAAGVELGLGTDGPASNNDLDLFSEMDRAAKLQKVFRSDPVTCSAAQVLRMATAGGARTLGWGEAIGSLEVGRKADLVALDARQPHLTPLYDPISSVVYTARGSDVRHVWVGGEQVVCDGRVTTVDVGMVLQEIQAIARKVKSSLKTLRR